MGTWHLSSSFSQGLCFSFSGSQVPCWAFRHHISLPGGRRGKGVDVLLLDVSSSLEREAFLRDFCLSLAGRNWAMWLPQLQESWHSKDFTFPAIIAAEGRRERGCNGFQRPNLWCLLWVSISVPAIVPYASPTCHHGPLHSEDLPSSPSSALCLSPCLAPWSEGVPLWTLYFKVITLLIIPTLALFLLILSSRAIVNIWHSLSPYIYSNPNTSSEIYEFCLLFFFFFNRFCLRFQVYLCKHHRGTPAWCRQKLRGRTSSSSLTLVDRSLYSGAFVGPWASLGAWAGAWPWFEAWPWPLVGTPVTLGKMGMSTFPELGVKDVGKSMEFAAATFCDLGLTSLGLTRALMALTHVLVALTVSARISFRPFCASWKSTRSSGTRGPPSSEIHVFVTEVSWCRFCTICMTSCAWVFLGLDCVCTEASGSRGAWHRKTKRNFPSLISCCIPGPSTMWSMQ